MDISYFSPDDFFYKCSALSLAQNLNILKLLPITTQDNLQICENYLAGRNFAAGPGLSTIWILAFALKSNWIARFLLPCICTLGNLLLARKIFSTLTPKNKYLALALLITAPLTIWLSFNSSTDIYATLFAWTSILIISNNYANRENSTKTARSIPTKDLAFLGCIVGILAFRPLLILTIGLAMINIYQRKHLSRIITIAISVTLYILLYSSYGGAGPEKYALYSFSPPAPEWLWHETRGAISELTNTWPGNNLKHLIEGLSRTISLIVQSLNHSVLTISGIQAGYEPGENQLKLIASTYKVSYGITVILPGILIILARSIQSAAHNLKFLFSESERNKHAKISICRDSILLLRKKLYQFAGFYLFSIMLLIPHTRYTLPVLPIIIIAQLEFWKLLERDA